MRVVVCVKQVLDPDAVNNYALEGRLEIGDDGKTITQAAIPRLMNAYDEQAIEAALRLRDAGLDVKLTVVSVGEDLADILKHSAALGAEEIVEIPAATDGLDGHAIAHILSKYVESTGGADLVLCGRQASDDDQGVVPALIGENLGMPTVTIARDVASSDGNTITVTRATPDGDEVVEVSAPLVVTVSNELGTPRYPTMQMKMKARKMSPTTVSLADLGIGDTDLVPRVVLSKQFVPTVQGDCEFIDAASASEAAAKLVARLRDEQVI